MHAAHLLRDRAALSPQREALLELATGRRYTYAELDARANRAAHVLAARFGVRAGDRVAVLAHNSTGFVELFFAAGKLGAVLVPLNWRLAAAELAYMLADSTPIVLVCGPGHEPIIEQLLRTTELPPRLAIDGAAIAAPAYEDELARAAAKPPETPPLTGDDPYCILYTSGTTGKPKGAVIPHRQVLWNCISTVASWALTDRDVSPVFTPLFHAGGLFAFLTPILYAGGRIVLGRSFEGGADLRTIERERCTVVLGVPTMFHMWRESPEYRDADFSAVRFFISGGAPCPPSLLHAWRTEKHVVMRQGYGLTEVGPNCFAMSDDESVAKSGSVGRPLIHLEARIVGDGDVGELALRGPQVCAGYWGRPEATAEALRDGWFHTGDLVRRDADGFFSIVGRAKDMIISGGENVYAAEVEAVLADHPAVAEAALVGVPDDRWGEVGVAAVIKRPGSHASEAELQAFCSSRLARYKIPRRVVFVDDFPRTALGKPQKADLRRRYLEVQP
jgi:fatty-acyl-CoA synthase